MKISNGKIQVLALCGILSPIVYVVTVALADFWTPPSRTLVKPLVNSFKGVLRIAICSDALLVIYNDLIIPFAVGLYFGLKRGLTRSLVLVTLVLTGILGTAVTVFFPLDAAGQSVTFTGMMHLVVVGLVVPCTFVFMIGFWNSARKDQSWGKLGLFSIGVFVVTLISGITTGRL